MYTSKHVLYSSLTVQDQSFVTTCTSHCRTHSLKANNKVVLAVEQGGPTASRQKLNTRYMTRKWCLHSISSFQLQEQLEKYLTFPTNGIEVAALPEYSLGIRTLQSQDSLTELNNDPGDVNVRMSISLNLQHFLYRCSKEAWLERQGLTEQNWYKKVFTIEITRHKDTGLHLQCTTEQHKGSSL